MVLCWIWQQRLLFYSSSQVLKVILQVRELFTAEKGERSISPKIEVFAYCVKGILFLVESYNTSHTVPRVPQKPQKDTCNMKKSHITLLPFHTTMYVFEIRSNYVINCTSIRIRVLSHGFLDELQLGRWTRTWLRRPPGENCDGLVQHWCWLGGLQS